MLNRAAKYARNRAKLLLLRVCLSRWEKTPYLSGLYRGRDCGVFLENGEKARENVARSEVKFGRRRFFLDWKKWRQKLDRGRKEIERERGKKERKKKERKAFLSIHRRPSFPSFFGFFSLFQSCWASVQSGARIRTLFVLKSARIKVRIFPPPLCKAHTTTNRLGERGRTRRKQNKALPANPRLIFESAVIFCSAFELEFTRKALA